MTMDLLRSKVLELKTLKDCKEVAEDNLAQINKDIERVSQREIPEIMAALDLKNATFEGIGRVQLASDIFASTRAGKKDEAMQWLRDCGYEEMIAETYNASSLKALFRRLLIDGAEIPVDIFSVTPFTRASVVKA